MDEVGDGDNGEDRVELEDEDEDVDEEDEREEGLFDRCLLLETLPTPRSEEDDD